MDRGCCAKRRKKRGFRSCRSTRSGGKSIPGTTCWHSLSWCGSSGGPGRTSCTYTARRSASSAGSQPCLLVRIRLFTVHGWSFAAYRGPAGRLCLWAERLVRPITTAVICVSHASREQGIAARACNARRTVVIHNAVDTTSFLPTRRTEGPPRIISVARFAFPKDFAALVRALAMVSADYRATFVGEGPALSDIATAVEMQGLEAKVELLGARGDVRELLASSDIFVLSSRSEGHPVSLLEAMAAGLPVVATDVGGVAESVVHGQTGLLVPAGNVTALAAALERLVEDEQLRRRLGTAGR